MGVQGKSGPQRPFGEIELTQCVISVGESDMRGHVIGPARKKCRIGLGRWAGLPCAFECDDRFEITRAPSRGRYSFGRNGDHRPVPTAFPEIFEYLEGHFESARGARAQRHLARAGVVTYRDGIVPAVQWPHTEIEQYDRRCSTRDFAQHVVVRTLEDIRNSAVAPCCPEHFGLHASLALRYVNIAYELSRRDPNAGVHKCGGK